MTNLIKDVDYNVDLRGFVITLNDDRTVQVQFEKETNKLHGSYGLHYPQIHKEYSAEITEEEKKEILANKEILKYVNELDEYDFIVSKQKSKLGE